MINDLKVIIDLREKVEAPFYRSSTRGVLPAPWIMDVVPHKGNDYGVGKTFQTIKHLVDVVVNHVERARCLSGKSLARLKLGLVFGDIFGLKESRGDVMVMTGLLLEAFLRLRGIGRAEVDEICYGEFDVGFRFKRVDLSKETENGSADERAFWRQLEEWKRLVKGEESMVDREPCSGIGAGICR